MNELHSEEVLATVIGNIDREIRGCATFTLTSYPQSGVKSARLVVTITAPFNEETYAEERTWRVAHVAECEECQKLLLHSLEQAPDSLDGLEPG